MKEFEAFSKISRGSRGVIVTEKIDGTNAQICIEEDGSFQVGSRNRWITPENDNAGFARWAYEHKDELMTLGIGRHFGEWWGQGIQRRYGLDEKRFSLFNTLRWNKDHAPPSCCHVVPILWQGPFDDFSSKEIMQALKISGSIAAPGFMNPEGIVMYHTAAKIMFKKTFDKDDTGKWDA